MEVTTGLGAGGSATYLAVVGAAKAVFALAAHAIFVAARIHDPKLNLEWGDGAVKEQGQG